MGERADNDALTERIAELEAENLSLKKRADSTVNATSEGTGTRSKGRLRSVAAVLLILCASLLAPVSVIGTWVRAQLVDTDRFVQTFAPLAEKPEVQSFLADEVMVGVEQSVDIDAMVSDLFDGIATLDLPPAAAQTLPLLEGTAANGVRSLIAGGVETVVQSPQFAGVWEITLRETHSRAIAVIQGDPNAMLQLSGDGALTLNLATITGQVKESLVAQGVGFADAIPVIDRTVPILASDSLALVKTLYQLATAIGFWLPWVALGVLAAGVLIARNRMRAMSLAGLGVAASLLLLSAGVGIGKLVVVGSLSPSIMPAATAEVVFVQLTELIASTLLALIVLFLCIAVGAWLAGSSRLAGAARGALESGFAAVRGAADRRGLGTGAFGRFLDRWHSALVLATVLVAVLVLFLVRPITVSGVFATLLIALLVLCLIEVLRRPSEAAASEAEAVASESADGSEKVDSMSVA